MNFNVYGPNKELNNFDEYYSQFLGDMYDKLACETIDCTIVETIKTMIMNAFKHEAHPFCVLRVLTRDYLRYCLVSSAYSLVTSRENNHYSYSGRDITYYEHKYNVTHTAEKRRHVQIKENCVTITVHDSSDTNRDEKTGGSIAILDRSIICNITMLKLYRRVLKHHGHVPSVYHSIMNDVLSLVGTTISFIDAVLYDEFHEWASEYYTEMSNYLCSIDDMLPDLGFDKLNTVYRTIITQTLDILFGIQAAVDFPAYRRQQLIDDLRSLYANLIFE